MNETCQKRVAAGMCITCGCREPVAGHRHCPHCKEYKKQHQQRNKRLCFEAYGGAVCSCCGETEMAFLSIDHIDGGGENHRKAIRRQGSGFHSWLVKNNFPSGFQVLCMNCQFGKSILGECPHKKKER